MKDVKNLRIATRLLAQQLQAEELEVVYGGLPQNPVYTNTKSGRHLDNDDITQ